MKWMRERDLLIAQTMEFVQSVTGKKPGIEISPRLRRSFPTRARHRKIKTGARRARNA